MEHNVAWVIHTYIQDERTYVTKQREREREKREKKTEEDTHK